MHKRRIRDSGVLVGLLLCFGIFFASAKAQTSQEVYCHSGHFCSYTDPATPGFVPPQQGTFSSGSSVPPPPPPAPPASTSTSTNVTTLATSATTSTSNTPDSSPAPQPTPLGSSPHNQASPGSTGSVGGQSGAGVGAAGSGPLYDPGLFVAPDLVGSTLVSLDPVVSAPAGALGSAGSSGGTGYVASADTAATSTNASPSTLLQKLYREIYTYAGSVIAGTPIASSTLAKRHAPARPRKVAPRPANPFTQYWSFYLAGGSLALLGGALVYAAVMRRQEKIDALAAAPKDSTFG